MTTIGWIQILLYCAIIVAITPVLGAYMTRVFNGERTFLSPVLRPVEAAIYWAGGVDEKREQNWLMYTVGMLLFHVGGFLILYGLMRFQAVLPFNPAEQSAVAPDLTFNTAVSFITNTNWQNYGGEGTLSYLTADARPHAPELPVGGDRHRAGSCAHSRVRARVSKDDRQFLGRYHPLHALHPDADLRRRRAVPGLAGHAADARPLCRCHHAGRRQADHRGRSGRIADRDQDARHQWRRLLQRQCRASIREPDRVVELPADHLDLRARRVAHQRLRPHGRQPAPGLGNSRASMGVLFIAASCSPIGPKPTAPARSMRSASPAATWKARRSASASSPRRCSR